MGMIYTDSTDPKGRAVVFIEALLDDGVSMEAISEGFNNAFKDIQKRREREMMRRVRVGEIKKAIEYYVKATYGQDLYTDEYLGQVAERFAHMIDEDIKEVKDLNASGYVKVQDTFDGDAVRVSDTLEVPKPKYATEGTVDGIKDVMSAQAIIDRFVRKL